MTSSSVLLYFIHDRTTKPRVIATRLAHSSLQMTMRPSCGRSTSEIRWLRTERLARIEPARRRNRLIPCDAGYPYELTSSARAATSEKCQEPTPVCTENLIRVDDVMESPKLAE